MPGHCCPLSWCALRVAATRTAPRPGHPAPPGIQGWHEATCRSQSTPTAFPSPLPHDTGSTRPRGPILHRDNRRTAPQPQALRPSSLQRRTGTYRVEVPRCRWLRGGSPAGESAQPGVPEPCVCFWPSSCTYIRSPRGNLVQTRASSSHRPLLPSPPAPVDPEPAPIDPEPHCPPSTSARLPMTRGPAPRELGESRTVLPAPMGRGPGGARSRLSPPQVPVQTRACCSLPCPVPSCSSCPGTSRGTAERREKGRDEANSPGAAAATVCDNLRGRLGTDWARPEARPRELPRNLGCPKAA